LYFEAQLCYGVAAVVDVSVGVSGGNGVRVSVDVGGTDVSVGGTEVGGTEVGGALVGGKGVRVGLGVGEGVGVGRFRLRKTRFSA